MSSTREKSEKPKMTLFETDKKGKDLSDFILGAEKDPLSLEREKLPWEDKEFSKKLKPFMNFSLDEEYILKLRWISRKIEVGQQEIIRRLLRPYLDEQISQLLAEEDL